MITLHILPLVNISITASQNIVMHLKAAGKCILLLFALSISIWPYFITVQREILSCFTPLLIFVMQYFNMTLKGRVESLRADTDKRKAISRLDWETRSSSLCHCDYCGTLQEMKRRSDSGDISLCKVQSHWFPHRWSAAFIKTYLDRSGRTGARSTANFKTISYLSKVNMWHPIL